MVILISLFIVLHLYVFCLFFFFPEGFRIYIWYQLEVCYVDGLDYYMSYLLEFSMYRAFIFFYAKWKQIEIRKEYFEIPWASLRSMVEPSFARRSVINHRDYFTNGRIITSSAINITETEVLTAEGHLIAYDYLVIATGHANRVPKTKTEKLNQYEAGKTIK